jgi:phosphatidate cytidylyltransferase
MMGRLVTAAIGIPLIVAATLAQPRWPLLALIAAAGLMMFWEFARAELIEATLWAWCAPVLFVVILATPIERALPIFFLCSYLALLPLARPVLQLCWIGMPLWALAWIGFPHAPWMSPALLLFCCLWAGDTAAFVVGRSLGRHKLAPTISPNKTWEGAGANFAASCLVGAFAGGALAALMTWQGLMVGAIIGVLGQAGDIYESSWKRKIGLKDSGALLPGHGGLLDRFDSLLFAAPAVAVALYAFGNHAR